MMLENLNNLEEESDNENSDKCVNDNEEKQNDESIICKNKKSNNK